MKIGIITFWQSYDNYGQLLQCWALQQQLLRMGHQPFLIRYNYHFQKDNAPFWKRIIKFILIKPYIKKREAENQRKNNRKRNLVRQFDKFRQIHLLTSDMFYETVKQLSNYPPKADVYITGSDQVWAQPLTNKGSSPFFLQFGNPQIKRISYAPSFSTQEYPAKMKNELKRVLDKFCYVSVREKEGVEICRSVGINATHVVDPTLLLDRNIYYSLIEERKVNKNFVYIYSININKAEDIRWNELNSICKSRCLSIIVTPSSGYIVGKELFGKDVIYEYSSIEMWLSNIANAKMLVTTSFHGVVFALIMHCPFIYVPIKGKYEKGNSRVIELLNDVGLNNRIVRDNTSINDLFNEDIKWDDVDEILNLKKNKSILFLEEALK